MLAKEKQLNPLTMKHFLFYIFVICSVLGCKKDDPETQLAKIEGAWKLVAREDLVEGKSTWVDVRRANSEILVFREDGLPTDEAGYSPCCIPASLSIDGVLSKIIPKSEVSKYEICVRANCAYCETWGISTNGNEITISYCGMYRTKYVRMDSI